MQYPNTKIETACAIRDSRAQLTQPYYDADAALLVATNGQILAAIPTTDPDEHVKCVSGSVPVDAIKYARKASARGSDSIMDLSNAETVLVNDATFTRPSETFPDYRAIIQDKARNTPDICIDAALLKRLSDALQDRTGKDHRVNFYLARNPDGTIDSGSPIRVEAAKHPERIGLIMPCRID